MNKRFYVLILFLILPHEQIHAQQVTLQPWVQVYGTVNGQELGRNVTGIVPTVNLPYRAAVSSGGKTSFYRLQTPTDTSEQLKLDGDNLHLGDLNGDGYQDIVLRRIGATTYIDTVVLYWGTPTGVDTLNPIKLIFPPTFGREDKSLSSKNGKGKQHGRETETRAKEVRQAVQA